MLTSDFFRLNCPFTVVTWIFLNELNPEAYLKTHPTSFFPSTSFILGLGDEHRKALDLSKGRRYLKIRILQSQDMIMSFSLAVLGLRVDMWLRFGHWFVRGSLLWEGSESFPSGMKNKLLLGFWLWCLVRQWASVRMDSTIREAEPVCLTASSGLLLPTACSVREADYLRES